MSLVAADLPLLSRLYDQLALLAPEERERWLARLPPDQARFQGPLREMLARHAAWVAEPTDLVLPALGQAPDPSAPQAGDLVGPYRLRQEIGQGGMGTVWLAERADGTLKRQVALKLPRLTWGSQLGERMARERDIAERLEHPHIARLYDAGVDERGRPYLALEYIAGQPIDAYCEAQGLTLKARLRLFLQVVRAVAYAHGRLVVHRDLKPSNVLVSADGQAHLLDFGIAKLVHEATPEATVTLQGRALTPHYASPEQIAGQPVTVQSDVYGLGVLLFQLLTGRLPFDAPRPGALEDAILAGDPRPASQQATDKTRARELRGELDAILAKALRRQPAERYAAAEALAQDIERYLAGETVSARPDSLGYRVRKAVRRHWLPMATAGAVLAAGLGGGAVVLVQARRASQATERERVVKVFVADLFRSGRQDGLAGGGQVGSVRSSQALLERGASLIRKRFESQPELQAELFGVVGQVFADMGADGLAADYFGQQVQALVALGAPQVEVGEVELAQAWALYRARRFQQADDAAKRSLARLPPDQDTALEAQALRTFLIFRVGKQPHFKEALAELNQRLQRSPLPAVRARAWAAFATGYGQLFADRVDLARASWDEAIRGAIAAEGPLSPTAVELRLLAASVLVQYLPRREAEQVYLQAAQVLQGGGDARRLRELMTRLVFVENSAFSPQDMLAPAEILARLDEIQRALDQQSLQPPDWFGARLDFGRAMAMFWLGRPVEANRLVQRSKAILEREQTDLQSRTNRSWIEGQIAAQLGQHDSADALLRRPIAWAEAAGFGQTVHTASIHLELAQNFVMAQQWGRAEREISLIEAIIQPFTGAVAQKSRDTIQLLRAELLLGQGNPRAAARSLLTLRVPDDPTLRVRRSLTLGQAQCEGGQPHQGLALMLATERELQDPSALGAQAPESPVLARHRALIGRCAVVLKDLLLARAKADQARIAFIAQPEVGAYYKAPLIALERDLGITKPLP